MERNLSKIAAYSAALVQEDWALSRAIGAEARSGTAPDATRRRSSIGPRSRRTRKGKGEAG